jgi:xylulokinase
MARIAAGLEPSAKGAARWASTDRVVEPDDAHRADAEPRYQRFRMLTAEAVERERR